MQVLISGDLSGEVSSSLRITNRSDSRQAFKVKCSRNDLFRIRPATGVLDFNQSAEVVVTFKPVPGYTPVSDRHHFGIYHIPAPEGSTCTGAWAEHYGEPQGEMRLKVHFENR
ncbi:Major sperm protein [Aphelenchoides fujianensis]|nr:Major sperm protein [Aphelenchoides fujianensis]KAI6232862.1 Major sperm protein [Aphelenchoides fujianensis]